MARDERACKDGVAQDWAECKENLRSLKMAAASSFANVGNIEVIAIDLAGLSGGVQNDGVHRRCIHTRLREASRLAGPSGARARPKVGLSRLRARSLLL